MMSVKSILLFLAIMLTMGCHKTVTAPVPGAIDTVDSWAFRIVADSQAAIHSVKTWNQCSTNKFPITVVVDGVTEVCDPKMGTFPDSAKGNLNTAIQAYNVAQAAGQAYHAGKVVDVTRLTNVVNQLSAAIAALLSSAGGK